MKIDLPKIPGIVTIIGGGPSLKEFDFDRVKGFVITVNMSCFNVQSDMHVSLDKNFYIVNQTFIDKYESVLVSDRDVGRDDVSIIEYNRKGPSDEQFDWHMKKANLSGFAALGLALHLGAVKVYLLGFDGGYNGEESNHYKTISVPNNYNYECKNDLYDLFEEYNVINVGMDSKIESFQKVPLESNFYES